MLQLDLFTKLFGRPSRQKKDEKKPPSNMIVLTDQIHVHVKRRAYQRRWNLSVAGNGRVQVTCSRTSSDSALRNWLQQMLPWIEKALHSAKKAREKFPEKKYVEGEGFAFLGSELKLRFCPQHSPAVLPGEGVLRLRLVPDAPSVHKREAIIHLYKKAAKKHLTQRLEYWSECMGLYPRKLSFRGQRTRWGSCGANGTISLNWKLMAGPEDVIDYVIIHELAHLRHHNHSKAFWQLVEAYCPRRRGLSKWLRENQLAFDFLS